jgi:hypothetical protein
MMYFAFCSVHCVRRQQNYEHELSNDVFFEGKIIRKTVDYAKTP